MIVATLMLSQMLSDKLVTTRTVLINGDLVVHGFPKEHLNSAEHFLVYRVVDDQAWFWYITKDKIEAVSISSTLCGHVIQIKTIDK